MDINSIPKELIAKIQKLMRLEESAKSVDNLEEAANAAGKIRDILMKYNLDLYMVKAAGDQTQKEAPIQDTQKNPEELTKPHEGDWVTRMVKVIAPHYLCQCIGVYKSKDVCIIGTEINVQIVWYTVEQLTNRIRPLSRAAFRDYHGKEKRNTFFRGFYRGAVEGINAQLAENKAREVYRAKQIESERLSNQATTSGTPPSMEVMNINMQVMAQRRVTDYMQTKMNLKMGKEKSSSLSGHGGRLQGYETGKNINISSGLGAGAKTDKSKWLN